MSIEEIRGLTSAEVSKRLEMYGFNRVEEKKESFVKVFLKKFTGLTPYTIEVAAVISFFLHRYVDFVIMIALLLVNAVIGVLNEFRAEKAIEMLKARLKIVAKVLRDGRWVDVPSEEIVPDDIVKLSMGDIIPADAKILKGSLIVDESALTGESIPVEKNTGDPVYAGTTIVRGEAIVKIVATGARTRFGRTVELVQIAKPRLIIEKITNSITKWLLAVDSLFIILVVFKLLVTGMNIFEVLPFALTLILASIPIALPAMTTITLALGSFELAKNGVIVRRLEAIEAAAMMDVMCLDKTGTITENKIVVEKIIPLQNTFREEDIILFAALASEEVTKDPIDNAIWAKARELKIDLSKSRVLEFKPFSPETKRSEALVEIENKKIRIVKGAPQVLEQIAYTDRESLNRVIVDIGREGLRPLAIAIDSGNGLSIIGVIGLYDRPREDSKKFIEMIRDFGVMPKMITGDNVYIAKTIAEKVDLGSRALSIREVSKDKLYETIDSADVFAEVVPEDKYYIVESLQRKGHVVGMTGDGVNDSPALKKADLGVAVSNATDVAKSVASVVLTLPGLKNIVDIIKLGRVIYRRIVVWSLNKIVKTFSIVYFVAISTLLLDMPIITPTHMILMLFLYDFVTLSISTDILKPSKKPERWNIRKLVAISTILGVAKLIELFAALYIALKILNLQYHEIQTFIFYILLLSGLLNILNFRELSWFWKSKPSTLVTLAITADIIVATIIVWRGLIIPQIPLQTIFIALIYTIAITLILTDALKISIYKIYGYV